MRVRKCVESEELVQARRDPDAPYDELRKA
jgi:hypothetical protein